MWLLRAAQLSGHSKRYQGAYWQIVQRWLEQDCGVERRLVLVSTVGWLYRLY